MIILVYSQDVKKTARNCHVLKMDVFENTAKRVCLKQNDLCLGIKLLIDATHTDIHDN